MISWYQKNIYFCIDESRQPLAARSSWRVLFYKDPTKTIDLTYCFNMPFFVGMLNVLYSFQFYLVRLWISGGKFMKKPKSVAKHLEILQF